MRYTSSQKPQIYAVHFPPGARDLVGRVLSGQRWQGRTVAAKRVPRVVPHGWGPCETVVQGADVAWPRPQGAQQSPSPQDSHQQVRPPHVARLKRALRNP